MKLDAEAIKKLKALGYVDDGAGGLTHSSNRSVAPGARCRATNLESGTERHATKKDRDETRDKAAVFSGRPVQLWLFSYRSRVADPDAICGKHLIDCLTVAGIIEDDSAKEIQAIFIQQIRCKKGEERTEVIIMPKERS